MNVENSVAPMPIHMLKGLKYYFVTQRDARNTADKITARNTDDT